MKGFSKSRGRTSAVFGFAAFGLATAMGAAAAFGGDASAINIGDGMVINPVYQQYMNDVAAGNGANWKLAPSKYVFNGQTGGGKGSGEALPASYNLVNSGYATTLKNQGSDADCWAFATTTAMESYLKKTQGKSVEFSPKQLDYLTASGSPYYNYMNTKLGYERELGEGGNFVMASYPLSGQYAPVSEAGFFAKLKANDADLGNYNSWREFEDYNTLIFRSAAYNKAMNINSVMGEKSNYLLTDYEFYAGEDISVAEIKNSVYNYGAVYVGTYAPGTTNCWDATKKVIVDRGLSVCGEKNAHAMAIVGWDDNYTYTDPASNTTKTGAFIVQNSYGKSSLFSDRGISYDDVLNAFAEAGETLTDEQKEIIRGIVDGTAIHEFAYLGYDFSASDTINLASIRGMRTNDYANVYDLTLAEEGFGGASDEGLTYVYDTGSEAEYIEAIQLDPRIAQAPFDVDYTIYVDTTGTGENFEEVGVASVGANEMMRKTIDLDEPVAVVGKFAVKVMPMVGSEVATISSDIAPLYTVTAYTVGEEEVEIEVPDTAAAPNTGMFTGDNNGAFGGVVAAVVLIGLSGIGVVMVKERKSLFDKVKFEKK